MRRRGLANNKRGRGESCDPARHHGEVLERKHNPIGKGIPSHLCAGVKQELEILSKRKDHTVRDAVSRSHRCLAPRLSWVNALLH